MENNKLAVLCLGKIHCCPMALARRSALVVLFIASVFWPIPVPAESVPGHIVSMTKELLLATRSNFTSAVGNDEQAQRVQRVYRILKREGLYNWHKAPFTRDGFVPKMTTVFGLNKIGSAENEKFEKFLESQTGGRSDAAIDELYTSLGRARLTGAERKRVVDNWSKLWSETWADVALTHEIEGNRGPETISLIWDMDGSRFTIRVLEKGTSASGAMQTNIIGFVRFSFDQAIQNLVVSVQPTQMPITSGKPDIKTASIKPNQARLQPKDKPTREKKSKSTTKKSEVRDTRKPDEHKKKKGKKNSTKKEKTSKQQQIDAKRQQIVDIKNGKVYVWENTETGEKTRQTRFRKLKDPFTFIGEDYANPEGARDVERLEREIASLQSGAQQAQEENTLLPDASGQTDATASDTPSTSPPTLSRGSIFSLTKTIYYHDEPIIGNYSIPKEPPYSYRFHPLAKGYMSHDIGSSLFHLENQVKKWLSVYRNLPFVDYELQVDRLNQRISTTYFRQLRHEPLIPGAIKLPGGPNHDYGKAVVFNVDVPSERLSVGGDKHNVGTRRRMYLELVRLGRRIRGGAVIADEVICSDLVKTSHMRINLSEFDGRDCLSVPGLYEIRLVSDGFALDQVRLNLTVNELPGSLRLSSSKPVLAGENISVIFDAPDDLLPWYYYSLELFRLDKDGRAERVGWNIVKDVKPGKPIVVGGVNRGGDYTVRLSLHTSIYTIYVIDELDFKVGTQKTSLDSFHFTINGTHVMSDQKIIVNQGDKIPVEVSLRGKGFMPGATLKVELYKASEGAANRMRGGHMPTLRSDKPIKQWELDSGRKSAWKIDGNLPPGRYDLNMFSKIKGKQFPYFARTFEVVPASGALKLKVSGRRKIDLGEPITVTVSLPGSYSLKKSPLILQLEKVGGRVPGCAIESYISGSRYETIDIDQRQSYSFSRTRQPGIYLIRLFHLQDRNLQDRKLMDEIAVEVVARPAKGALVLAGGREYRPGEKIRMNVTLPPDHPISKQAGLNPNKGFVVMPKLVIVRHGAIAVGGGVSHAGYMYGQNYAFGSSYASDQFVAGKMSAEFSLTFPGSYEARLYQKTGSCDVSNDLCPLLAVQPFVVRDPRSPFNLNTGLGRIDLRNDLPRRDDSWPPIGEYLTGEDCKPRIPKLEKLKLRIVRWDNGNFVPIEGALDYGESFYLEGKLEQIATRDSYIAQMKTPDGEEQEVTLFVSENDPKVVRSEMLYFIWESEPDTNDPRH